MKKTAVIRNPKGLYNYVIKNLLKDFQLKPISPNSQIQEIGGERAFAGIAYIYIPQDISREEYINKCLRTNLISLINENERLDNVIISQNIVKDLVFPKNKNELGSGLSWIKISPTNQILAISIVNKKDEIILDKENQINISKEDKDIKIGLIGDISNRFLNVEIENKGNTKSELNLRLLGKNLTSIFNIFSSGILNFFAKNEINIESNNRIKIIILDEESGQQKTSFLYIKNLGFFYEDEFDNKFEFTKVGFLKKIGETKIEVNKEGSILIENQNKANFILKLKDNEITINESGILIENKNNGNIRLKNKSNDISLTDAGINIDSGENSVYINGSNNVLYSKIPDATQIIDVSEIGISKNVKVGD